MVSGVWVVFCLAYVSWQHANGRLLSLLFFACATLPCLLIAIVFPDSLWRSWRIPHLESAIAKSLDAAVTVAFGTAVGVIWARLVATNLYPTMDARMIRGDSDTRRAAQLIGSFGLAGSFLGWQSVTVVCLITGLLAVCVSYELSRFRPFARFTDWSVFLLPSLLVYLALEFLLPEGFTFWEDSNPALRYTLVALVLILLAKLQPAMKLTDAAVDNEEAGGR